MHDGIVQATNQANTIFPDNPIPLPPPDAPFGHGGMTVDEYTEVIKRIANLRFTKLSKRKSEERVPPANTSMQAAFEMYFSTPSRTTSPTSPQKQKCDPYTYRFNQCQSFARRKANADKQWKRKVQSEIPVTTFTPPTKYANSTAPSTSIAFHELPRLICLPEQLDQYSVGKIANFYLVNHFVSRKSGGN